MEAKPIPPGMRDIESDSWLRFLRRYFPVIAVLNLCWEVAQLPLYTIWSDGSTGQLLFAVLHCTGGDLLVSVASLVLALILAGDGWPVRQSAYWRVAGLTLLVGLGYTIFSEWLNIAVRRTWAYSELMPVVPILNAGLSPLAQWILVPALGFSLARRWTMRPGVLRFE